MLLPEEIKKIKEKLEEMKLSLESEISQLEKPIDVGDFPGEDDNTDESTATFNRRSAAASLRQVLNNIDLALSKIQKGTYGICEKCGKEISKTLLEISPESKFCQECNKLNIS
jgi:DnaK suppressor protein